MRLCAWCEINPAPPRGTFCGRICRQAAHRIRKLGLGRKAFGPGLPPGARFAYADPPYPGLSKKYYGDQATFAGEVDHRRLVESLELGGYAGWALSTSSAALRELLPMCPEGTRVCSWVKPIGVPTSTMGIHSTWEVVLVVGGRKCQPGVRDWLLAQPARLSGSKLIGRKPLAFCAWLFDLLGMVDGDELVDFYPGTGGVGRAWRELSVRASATSLTTSRRAARQPMLSLVDELRPRGRSRLDRLPRLETPRAAQRATPRDQRGGAV